MANGRHGARRQKIWSSVPGIFLNLTGAGTSIGGSLGFNTADTVIRMLGSYTIAPTSAPVAGDAADIAVALGVISSDAFAAGAGSVPDPADEPEYPWLFWRHQTLHFPTTSADPSVASGSVRDSFDIRSMRKLKPRESLAWVIQYVDIGGVPPLSVSLDPTRVLLALA